MSQKAQTVNFLVIKEMSGSESVRLTPGTKNVCTKGHGGPSSSRWNISVWNKTKKTDSFFWATVNFVPTAALVTRLKNVWMTWFQRFTSSRRARAKGSLLCNVTGIPFLWDRSELFVFFIRICTKPQHSVTLAHTYTYTPPHPSLPPPPPPPSLPTSLADHA